MMPTDFIDALDRHRRTARVDSHKHGVFTKRFNFHVGDYPAFLVSFWDGSGHSEGGVVINGCPVVAVRHAQGWLWQQRSDQPWDDTLMVELALVFSE